MSDERGSGSEPTAGRVGDRLRAAREAAGLSLPEIAARTRVPQRHLEAIEASDYAGLPSPTYAVGFVRAYARAVGADEVEMARAVRGEAESVARPATVYEPYEIADPSRVPSRTTVIVAAGIALAVLLLGVLWLTLGRYDGGDAAATAPTVATAVPSPTPATRSAAEGQVTLIATDEVWMRVYDAADTTLFTGTLQKGERYDVPRDANAPMINIGRPDKVTVTLNGSVLPPLGSGERAIKDVPIGAAALAARGGATTPAAAPTASPATSGSRGAGGASAPSRTPRRDVPPAFADPVPQPAGASVTTPVPAPSGATTAGPGA